jgi:V/A-type H+/Na+-transporting ATPase subunit E
MKTLDKGHDKIKKISEQLRHEVLEPAKEETKKIIAEAHERAAEIVAAANKEAEKIISEARQAVEEEKNVFHSSLSQAGKQSIEALRQTIEQQLFNDQLHKALNAETTNPKIIASLIDAIVKAIDKEGLSVDLAAYIPKSVSAKDVNQFLLAGTLKQLKGDGVIVGDFSGGARIKMLDKNLTIDISDQALEELLSKYVRKDFRKLLFEKN